MKPLTAALLLLSAGCESTPTQWKVRARFVDLDGERQREEVEMMRTSKVFSGLW